MMRFVIFLCMISTLSAQSRRDILNDQLRKLQSKDTLTVLITDSGLGGLSVCADIERKAREVKQFPHLSLIFFNALAENGYGYNSMKSREEKVTVFSSALNGMMKWYTPDLILIACNTLSVLYDDTPFAATATIPVIGIVEIGADLIYNAMKDDSNSSVIIFGTPTTIDAGSHKALLIKKGISEDRIVAQACPGLESEIQLDAAGEAAGMMISGFMDEAISSLHGKPSSIVAGLCCTHYGYAIDRFLEALQSRGPAQGKVVDPNGLMADVLFSAENKRLNQPAVVSVHVVSQAVISPEEIASLAGLIEQVSPPTAEAFHHYELKKDLFDYSRTQ
jgi:glutamate racemase